jgi:hypothetical protein
VASLDIGCSGTLIHPEVVLYAAHCGTNVGEVRFGEHRDRPQRIARTRHCTAHPEASLGNGFDVAVCMLAEPIEDIPMLPLAAGCELDAVRPGAPATLVGFGLDREGGLRGEKRSTPVELGPLAADLVVEATETGACAGDSGGPLLIEQRASDPRAAPQHRLIGVLSASRDSACEPSVDHYSYAAPLIRWLEATAERDLTPCFDERGAWEPTPGCVEPASQLPVGTWSSACRDPSHSAMPTTTCGPAVDERSPDRTARACSLSAVPAQRDPSALGWAMLVVAAGALLRRGRHQRRVLRVGRDDAYA